MARNLLEVVAAAPGLDRYQDWLVKACAKEGTLLVAFSAGRLRAASGVLGEGSDATAVAFHEWVGQTLEFCGGFAQRLASEELQLAAMAEVCAGQPSDSPFYESRRFGGLHRALCRTLSELREWGVDPPLLGQARRQAGKDLGRKLEALLQIEEEFRELLRKIGYAVLSDTLDDVESSEPEPGQSLPPAVLLADAEYTPRRARFVEWLVRHDCDVRMLVHRHPGGEIGFDGAARWVASLGGEARAVGDPAGWVGGLFGGRPTEGGAEARVWSTPDPFFEAEWVVRGCLADLQEGLPPERIAIVTRDLPAMVPYLDTAAARLGLPISIPTTVPLRSNGFARLVQAVLEVCASDQVRSVEALLPFRYGTLSRTDREGLRHALAEAERTADPWAFLEGWADANQERASWLPGLLRRRREAGVASKSLAAWVIWLRDLMDEGDWAADDSGPRHLSARDRRAMRQLQATLSARAAVARALGGGALDVRRFRDLALEIWQNAESTVRDREDGVLVVSRSADVPAVDSLYVMGMLEGQLPRRRSEDPILWDADRAFLNEALRLDPPLDDSRAAARRERDEFVALCSTPRKRLTLSYPQTDDERDNVPAFYLREVERLTGSKTKVFRRKELPSAESPVCPEADRALSEALAAPRRASPEPAIRSEELRTRLAWDGQRPVWHERALDAYQCPFLAFARHGLRLESGRRLHPRHLVREAALRARLPEATGREDGWAIVEDALAALAREAERSEGPRFAESLLAVGRRVLRRWLERERVAQRLWPRQVVGIGVRAGTPGTHGYVPLDGGRFPFDAVYDVLWEAPGAAGATFYGSGPHTDKLEERDELLLALLIVGLFRKGASYHLEFETFGNRRRAFALGDTLGTRPGDPDHGVERRTIEGTPRSWVSTAQRLASEAGRVLRNLEVAPKPGDGCDRCAYGELCRRSKRFPERDEFDGDV
ncbi:MAG: PD-(D/E)XK nuclease family protein [Fimbriimonadaceae bacterium]